MCAIEAGKRGRRVVVMERSEQVGKKILISGGGRCNFTNLHTRPDHFLSSNPHFAKSALARYTPADFIAMVGRHRIPYHEKTLGQLFCDRSAREIVDMLLAECERAGVEIRTGAAVQEVRRADGYCVRAGDRELRAPALVVATGGLSIPKMGATGLGYDIARQFKIPIRETRPALVPLTFDAADLGRYGDLAGVSAEVIASAGSRGFREKMLFTHRGLSGPAILQISSYWRESEAVVIDLAPGRAIADAWIIGNQRRDVAAAKAVFREFLATRLADRWMELNAPSRWTNHAIAELEQRTHVWTFVPAGTEGYEKAEVTAGGVHTDHLSAKTMECRNVPGLFFIGEVVDVTGHLGGFNFQWAWASGFAAGNAV